MDEDTLTVWLDTALLMLGGFILLTVMLVCIVNPPQKKAEAEGNIPPGSVIVEVQWPDKIDADVDLWVQSPGDAPVGYSNKSGRLFNLLRDDLGKAQDVTDLNFEIAYTRGMIAGEYVVNVHLYRVIAVVLPVTVQVVVSVRGEGDKNAGQILKAEGKLFKLNDQTTVVRFRLDDKGALVPGSANRLYKELRSSGGTP